MTSAYDGAATPKTPTFTSVNCWEDEYGEPYYALAIRTSQIDNENHLLDRSKMYYEVDVNGENFTFDPEVYTTLDEPMKEVPLEFDDNDYFISYDNFQNFYIFRNDITSFGVRVVYYGGGERTATPTTLYEVAGVDAVVADADNSAADVYDLMGRKVNRDNLAPGIYIINHKKYLVK
jgi:NADPH-dependent 2,4-dienoyl-CoA reductase/sulfur reductase-like enzyme